MRLINADHIIKTLDTIVQDNDSKSLREIVETMKFIIMTELQYHPVKKERMKDVITLGDILDLLDETRTSSETVIIRPDKLSGPVKSHYWGPLEGRKVNNIGAEGPDKLAVWLEDEDDPEDARKLDEWCTDCKEYDKERHNCPRFNRVIREALKEVENG